jgi:hypothetical protein
LLSYCHIRIQTYYGEQHSPSSHLKPVEPPQVPSGVVVPAAADGEAEGEAAALLGLMEAAADEDATRPLPGLDEALAEEATDEPAADEDATRPLPGLDEAEAEEATEDAAAALLDLGEDALLDFDDGTTEDALAAAETDLLTEDEAGADAETDTETDLLTEELDGFAEDVAEEDGATDETPPAFCT